MPDSETVALVSTACTAGVAVVSVVVQARTASSARRHERSSTLENRSWEQQSVALVDAMTVAVRLRNITADWDGSIQPDSIIPKLREARTRLNDGPLSTLLLYSSDDLRVAIQEVWAALDRINLDDSETWQNVMAARTAKSEGIDAEDFARASEARHLEVTLLGQLGYPDRASERDLTEKLDTLIVELRREATSRRKRAAPLVRAVKRQSKALRLRGYDWSGLRRKLLLKD